MAPDNRHPDYSDVQSGSDSRAMTREDANETVVKYTVKKGDTLSRIAKEHYGDASKWRPIVEANSDLIKNPDLIHVGWVLTIPPKEIEAT
jgi:nucleoid-associated protein YgaU